MDNIGKIIIGLLIITAIVFIANPDFGKDGKIGFTIAPPSKTTDLQSDIACITAQNCIDFAIQNGAEENEIEAKCIDGLCVFTVDEFIQIVDEEDIQ